jgi:hypothetical protein
MKNPFAFPCCAQALVLFVAFLLPVIRGFSADDQSESMTPGPIEIIVGAGENAGYPVRYRTAQRLTRFLPSEDVETALEFLGRLPEDDPLPATALNAVKNELVLALLRQERPPRRVGTVLVEHFNNEAMDNGWRDYCLQLLRMWYPMAGASEREALVRLYVDATETNDATFAGTAIIALQKLSGDFGVIEPTVVAELAYKIAGDENQTSANRAAALHVGAELERAGILEVARDIIRNDANDVFLRMAAIAVIGLHGDGSDIAYLDSLLVSTDTRLRTAAYTALERLQ